jgi:hypothetical protein
VKTPLACWERKKRRKQSEGKDGCLSPKCNLLWEWHTIPALLGDSLSVILPRTGLESNPFALSTYPSMKSEGMANHFKIFFKKNLLVYLLSHNPLYQNPRLNRICKVFWDASVIQTSDNSANRFRETSPWTASSI